jgi:hypothetical protein
MEKQRPTLEIKRFSQAEVGCAMCNGQCFQPTSSCATAMQKLNMGHQLIHGLQSCYLLENGTGEKIWISLFFVP